MTARILGLRVALWTLLGPVGSLYGRQELRQINSAALRAVSLFLISLMRHRKIERIRRYPDSPLTAFGLSSKQHNTLTEEQRCFARCVIFYAACACDISISSLIRNLVSQSLQKP